jgi:hypothetical protein
MGSKIWKSGDFCVAGGVVRPDYCGVKKTNEIADARLGAEEEVAGGGRLRD